MTGILHIVVARKPIEGTVAENCLQWGCGALNIDGTRVGTTDDTSRKTYAPTGWGYAGAKSGLVGTVTDDWKKGRWPANLIVGGEEVVEGFPETTGKIGMTGKIGYGNRVYHHLKRQEERSPGVTDSGSAARFFFNITEQESDE